MEDGVIQMKKIRRILSFLMSFMLAWGAFSAVSVSYVEAAPSARKILNKAYKYMKSYDTVFLAYDRSYKIDDTEIYNEKGFYVSDEQVSHTIDIYNSYPYADEYWHKKGKVYVMYSGDSDWTTETSENDNSTKDKYFGKKLFMYCLQNAENLKLSSSGKDTYKITGTVDIKKIKKVTFTINKKKKCMVGMKIDYDNYKYKGVDGKNHSCKNEVFTMNNVCYGYGKLKMPNVLK